MLLTTPNVHHIAGYCVFKEADIGVVEELKKQLLHQIVFFDHAAYTFLCSFSNHKEDQDG